MALVKKWRTVAPPTLREEIDLIQLLGAAASLVPDSEINGTPQYRVFLVGQHGELVGSTRKDRHPLIFEVANMISLYMGSSDGKWKSDKAFDVAPNNLVGLFKKISSPWLPEPVQSQLWNYGVVYARSENMSRYFYPSFSSIYPEESSILSSLVNSLLCMSMEKVHFRTWARITGGQASEEQIIQRASLSVQDEVRGKYGSRFVIEPRTFFDKNDRDSGRSYHLEIHVYGNNPRVRFTYRPVAHQMSQLKEA